MKVLYDVSHIGYCAPKPNLRTGVFRVVKEVACHLAVSPEIEMSFCCNAECAHEAHRYIDTISQLKGIPFASSLRQMLDNKLRTAYEKPSTAFTDKVQLKFFHATSQIIGKPVALPDTALSSSQIYHTPAIAIPDQTRKHPRLIKFQTFYDLSPIRLPEIATQEQIDWVNAIVKNLHPGDWVLADSQSAKNDLCDYAKFAPDNVVVTYLAADQEKFYPCDDSVKIRSIAAKYGIPEYNPYLLSVCTLEPRKNLEHVIRCFANLLKERALDDDVRLVLVGAKGWKTDSLFTLLKDSETVGFIKDRIIITGFVDDADLSPLYSGALAFLYMSLYEGFGLPPLEAMQCGTPVIVSNTSSLPEVVGDAGIQLSPQDTDALCQAILEVYSRPELRQEMGLKSRERAKKFTWQRCAQETIAAYKMALTRIR